MRFPIIILDGPDGTGKTTLATELANQFTPRGKVLHLTKRWLDKMPLYHFAAWRCALRWSQHQAVIIDRWHLSERVYAAAYRGGTRWPHLSSMLDSLAKSRSALMILALPRDKDRYLTQFRALRKTREEMYSSGEELVWDGYHNELQKTYNKDASVFRYDIISNPNSTAHFASFYKDQALLRTRFNVTKRQQISLLDEVNFTGSFSARYLLVGDITNAYRLDTGFPFFDLKFGPASTMIHRVLASGEVANLYPSSWAMVNSRVHVHGQVRIERLKRIVTDMPFLDRVVALGNHASDELERLNIKHVTVGHPAYVARFGGSTKVATDSYVTALRDVLKK